MKDEPHTTASSGMTLDIARNDSRADARARGPHVRHAVGRTRSVAVTQRCASMVRIARDRWFGGGMQRTYWNFAAFIRELARLLEARNREFRRHVLRDQWAYLARRALPLEGETEARAEAAVQWLLLAQRATPDDGVPVGYFPCLDGGAGWLPSYPETTGYIISTLLAYADKYGHRAARDAALRMAAWEIETQMPSGAIAGGPVCDAARQRAAAFNTGMVLDGWCSAFQATSDAKFLEAGRRAADFLAADVDSNGYFRTNGAYVSAGDIKTYTCLCAWALWRFADISSEHCYREIAVRVVEAALRQQQPNGWFAHNCLQDSLTPHTHTVGYALQGILEVGVLAQRDDFVNAVRKGVDPLCARIDSRGFLPGRVYPDWQPASFSSCLTGNAQIAIVCFRLYELTRIADYKQAGDSLTNALKGLQLLDSPLRELTGAIAGSFPLLGEYMRAGYPNWATKYFIDALMLQESMHEMAVRNAQAGACADASDMERPPS